MTNQAHGAPGRDGGSVTASRPGTHAPGRPTPDLPEHVTTPLLTRLTQQSLDADYQVVADRRAARAAGDDGSPTAGATARSRWVVIGSLAVLGLLAGVAAVQNSRNAAGDELSRATLVQRIKTEKKALATQQKRTTSLREEVSELEAARAALRTRTESTEAQVRALAGSTGRAAVSGPGVVIRMDDRDVKDPNKRVRDSDLTLVVNGLWSAGAEGVEVNGHRLTSLSPIRNSGFTVLVNGAPLSSPYRVSAIGAPGSLGADWAATQSARDVTALADAFGVEMDLQNRDEVHLPAAPEWTLRHASELPGWSGQREREKQ